MKPMIVIEEYLDKLCKDINLFCFYGKVQIIRVLFIDDYAKKPIVSFYDPEWNLITVDESYFHVVQNIAIDKPRWLDQLVAFTGQMTQNIDHVRVDYFDVGDEIYFGEFSFTSGPRVVPPEFQSKLGSYWIYPEEIENFGQVTIPETGLIGTVEKKLKSSHFFGKKKSVY